MLMLKKTHERMLSECENYYIVELHKRDRKILKQRDEIDELIQKNNADIDRAEKELEKQIGLKNIEIEKKEELRRKVAGRVGGLVKENLKLKNQNKMYQRKISDLDTELQKAKKLIEEYMKPTKEELKYRSKVDKSKLVDSERRAKKEKLKKYVEKGNIK